MKSRTSSSTDRPRRRSRAGDGRLHAAAARPLIACAAIAAALAAAPGCNIVGPAAFLIAGPEKTQAMYTLPDTRPAVVFVDDRQSVLPNRQIRQRISKAAEATLLEGDAVSEAAIVSSDAVLAVASRERFGKPMGIADVGDAVGAEVVVYATVDQFSLSPDGTQFAPFARLRVKVVDAKSKERLWPASEADAEPGAAVGEELEWHTLNVDLPMRSGVSPPRSQSERTVAENQFADYVGRALGNVFLKHETRDANPRIG